MTTSDYSKLKDYILSENPYLNTGYANAFKDNKSNMIFARDVSGDLALVFPSDTDGDYFYLRNDEGITFRERSFAGCTPAFDDTILINMVFVLRDADINVLLSNIRKTLVSYTGLEVKALSANWNREQILIDEMSGADENEVLRALQRLDNQTILRIRTQVTGSYVPNNCSIVNPCKC